MEKDSVIDGKPILDRFKLDRKTALVTGGGQGIGRAFAHALGEAGAKIAVVDLIEEKAERVCGELRKKNIDCLPVKCDCTKKEDIKNMIHKIKGSWGKLTIAVNNAGLCVWNDAEKMSEEIWDKQIDLNLKGTFMCAQEEAKGMLEEGYGKIINTASMSGHIVNYPQHQSAYNASKAGVIHLTKSLAVEWAKQGIRVNSISPTYTKTKLVADLIEKPEGKEMVPTWMEFTPMGKMAKVTDLQGAVVFLASEASDFITGHDIVMDGGYCCL